MQCQSGQLTGSSPRSKAMQDTTSNRISRNEERHVGTAHHVIQHAGSADDRSKKWYVTSDRCRLQPFPHPGCSVYPTHMFPRKSRNEMEKRAPIVSPQVYKQCEVSRAKEAGNLLGIASGVMVWRLPALRSTDIGPPFMEVMMVVMMKKEGDWEKCDRRDQKMADGGHRRSGGRRREE